VRAYGCLPRGADAHAGGFLHATYRKPIIRNAVYGNDVHKKFCHVYIMDKGKHKKGIPNLNNKSGIKTLPKRLGNRGAKAAL
jgi:hypothetical protein